MKSRYILPELPAGDRWLSTRQVAELISPPVDIEELREGMGDAFTEETRKKFLEINEDRLRKTVNVIYSYLSQGLPAVYPLPKPDVKKHARNFWRQSTIDHWMAQRGSLIILDFSGLTEEEMDV
ncbi:hypothetical protein [Streptosporangium sp. NPDC049304]|uniref:hypothetical protein n=1 Tax=Streptosporangium sp. NPDC049304 TaxID=3154830 RepID=UPI00341294C6